MDLNLALSNIPGARPLAGLSSAWIWSPAPTLNFAAAVSRDERYMYRLNAVGDFDEELVAAILGFSRERGGGPGGEGCFLYPLNGFSWPDTGFEVVGVAVPSVHRWHDHEHKEFKDVAFAAFPGYRCEFSVTETEMEAAARFERMLRVADLRRSPVPYLKMRFQNTKVTVGSIGNERKFAPVKKLNRELALLENALGGFVEFENYASSVWLVEWWSDGWRVTGTSSLQFAEVDQLLEWAHGVLVN